MTKAVGVARCQTVVTKVKQAISTTRLFVQRALINLERGVGLLSKDAREWKWMKNYRVWEANRKVFLYPEALGTDRPGLRDE